MATRADGNQIGVQPNEIPNEFKQALLGMNYACLKLKDHPSLFGVYVQYRMAIGIMPGSREYEQPTDENKKHWVWVVAFCINKASPVEFMATTATYGDGYDSEFEGLPRIVTWDEVQQKGVLFGRFEGSSPDDLTWYFSYCKDNNEMWPAGFISFPSAAAVGPDGRRGGYRDGKAVAIIEV
jgi:hypothetical protein